MRKDSGARRTLNVWRLKVNEVKAFRDFLLRGNLVDLAVAVVIGAAFTALVTSFVADVITPLIAAIGGQSNFGDLSFTISGSHVRYGLFISALISFAISASVVYVVVVKPFSSLLERYMPK